ncbi:MAG: LysR family transcriptional regulator [Paracoccaceae bacterium]
MRQENWDDLRLFRIFAESGGISAAAQRLGMHRVTLGLRLRALEAALGLALLERRPRRVRLTEAGRRALERADAMAAEWQAAALDAPGPGTGAGAVRVAAPEGLAGWMLAPFADLFVSERARLVFVAPGDAAEIRLSFGPAPRARRIARIEYGVFEAPGAWAAAAFGPPWIEQGPPGGDLREWLDDCFDGAAGLATAEALEETTALALIRAGIGRGWLPARMAASAPGIIRRDRNFTRRRDLWLEIAGAAKNLTRVRLAADWVEACAAGGKTR